MHTSHGTVQGYNVQAIVDSKQQVIVHGEAIGKGLDKFSLRGKVKVNIQWLLYCMVHNIEKVANYGFA